ncbi:hypothetical protein J1N35_041924 [Gossypium stocksii]|uniref:Uncharacterized protein n=1 Tax=Gossypium stocksii TaxID=47602 RepID=A0A9D3ZJX2_9ROSI|nr:hypothetical protein J1N35_041924 [Gossypium stocksii]
MLEIGDHINDLRQLGMNLTVLLEQAINRFVRRLEPGEQIETRVSAFKEKCVIKKIGLPNSPKVEPNGFLKRVWILWKDIVDVIVGVNNFQFVHLKVKFSYLHDWALFTGIYRSPWVADITDAIAVINRGSLFECPDRALCNYQWDNLVPNSMVYHIHKIKFDHHPLAIHFGQYKTLKAPRPFRFLSSWLSHSDFGRFVNETWSNGEHLKGRLLPLNYFCSLDPEVCVVPYKILSKCVSTSTMQVLWNGRFTDEFKPTRGMKIVVFPFFVQLNSFRVKFSLAV